MDTLCQYNQLTKAVLQHSPQGVPGMHHIHLLSSGKIPPVRRFLYPKATGQSHF